jgi:hypothetical protein
MWENTLLTRERGEAMQQKKWMVAVLAALALVGISAPLRSLRAEDQPNIEEMVRNAKSPADHLALSDRYDELAADAQTQAARHRTMAEAYKGPGDPKGIVRSTAMVGHCETLAKSFDTQAQEYRAMAAAHREMAK